MHKNPETIPLHFRTTMHFPITAYKRFSDLPLQDFNKYTFSVYILDLEWKYLFVNDFVLKNLGMKTPAIIGKKMWEVFETLKTNPFFSNLKSQMEQGVPVNGITTSPITGQKLNITGYPLEDCFYFTSSILQNREELITDLHAQIGKH